MGRNVHIGNKCWKIMTIYSKGMKTEEGRMYALGRGLQLENRRMRSKKLGRGEGG
jgi:hypothetical protein